LNAVGVGVAVEAENVKKVSFSKRCSVEEKGDMSTMPSIVHIVNVVGIDGTHPSYLHIAQPITLASMVQAKQMALGKIKIDLLALRRPSETVCLPDEFIDLPLLQRSCRDAFPHLLSSDDSRDLPLLADILNVLHTQCQGHDLCVYTNVDIGLQPYFYLDILAKSLSHGLDAFCINKRIKPKVAWDITLTKEYLPMIHSLAGVPGGGTDCFVFKPSLLDKINVGRVFLGYPPIGRVLRLQLQANEPEVQTLGENQRDQRT
jgi:hypothetical protein